MIRILKPLDLSRFTSPTSSFPITTSTAKMAKKSAPAAAPAPAVQAKKDGKAKAAKKEEAVAAAPVKESKKDKVRWSFWRQCRLR